MLKKPFETALLCLTAALALVTDGWADGEVITLPHAERLALAADPGVNAMESRQLALDELAEAAVQLPDPLLKMGVMSLPTDTFQLGQEPMTQVLVGLVQRFPRGETRSLRSAQLREQGLALDAFAADLALRARLAVREEYLEVLKQRHLADINREAEAVFSDLEDITGDYYATGRVQQQDVLRAALERSRVRERATGIAEEEDRARARLATWIGEAAWQPLEPQWPLLPTTRPQQDLLDGLTHHPRLRALHQQVVAADRGVALAEQAYKPEFAVDLTYGGRGGTDMDGSERSDLLSVMVTMDLPLFTAGRQDRDLAARVAESSAAAYDRDDVYRRLQAELQLQARTLGRQRERLALFQNELLPEASFNAEATYSAYQAAVENLTTLMRARLTEFDLRLEYARLQAEVLKTQARLLYLQGETP